MSTQITTAFVKQFNSNVFHLSQQKGSRLRTLVRQESQTGKSQFFDRIGTVAAQKSTTRHADTPLIDTPHTRRRVTLNSFKHADLVDESDKIKLLIDPASNYSMSFAFAFGRAMDEEIITAALGNAFGGEEGNDTIALPATQKIAAHDGSTTVGVNLNVRTLRRVKEKFDANDVDETIPRSFAITSSQLQSLLAETEVTSSDFAMVKALVQGEVDTFMGFKFIRTELLVRSATDITYNVNTGVTGSGTGTITAANSRRCIAWAQDGLLLAIGDDIKARMTERDDKNYSLQVFMSMDIGSTRLEDVKVVEVDCSE